MREPITFRAQPGTHERLRELAQRSGKKPLTLAAELFELALRLTEIRTADKREEQTA